ncbi:MAG: alpha/beta hydrolase [Oleiphilaceae bacterium]|nr:alpha/beta hydrolase [Oleiphilaceae bacterium]
MKLINFVILLSAVLLSSACANLKNVGEASKSSPSLLSFIGLAELPDWYVGSRYTYPDSKWIENDFGLRIHYRERGEGPVVLLVHGEASSLHSWEAWFEALSQDHRVIAVDLPGSGLTGATHCIYENTDTCADNLSQDYIAHTLKYFIEDLKLNRFTLVGHSYGAYLSALYAKDNPARVEKLILLSPLAHQQDIPEPVEYLSQSSTELLASYVQPASLAIDIAKLRYAEHDRLTQAAVERYIHLSQTDGAFRSNVLQMKLVRQLMEEGSLVDFSQLGIQTLILWGERDKWGDVSHVERWESELPNAVVVRYPFVGNLIMEEDPELALPDVTAYIAGDPLPSIDGGGSSGSFTIQDAVDALDQEALFGAPKAAE